MQIRKRRLFIPALGLALLSLLWILSVTGVGQVPLRPFDITPSAYVHLPFIARDPTPTPTSPPGSPFIPPDDLENEQAVAEALNQHRSVNGVASLGLAPELTQAARRHSRDMADNNLTGHTGSDGSSAGQRMQEAGYYWSAWGEIIAWGFGGDPASAVSAWMNSGPHRDIILSSLYQDFGVGYAQNASSDWGHYWTVNFGRRASRSTAAPREAYVCTYSSQDDSGGILLTLYSQEPCL